MILLNQKKQPFIINITVLVDFILSDEENYEILDILLFLFKLDRSFIISIKDTHLIEILIDKYYIYDFLCKKKVTGIIGIIIQQMPHMFSKDLFLKSIEVMLNSLSYSSDDMLILNAIECLLKDGQYKDELIEVLCDNDDFQNLVEDYIDGTDIALKNISVQINELIEIYMGEEEELL